MPLENVENIDDLDPANPVVDDPVNEGDDHIRNLKRGLKKNVSGDNASTQLNQNDLVVLNADANGAQVTGQVTASEAVPVAAEDLTRKDFVDAQIAALQLQLDNILNGTTPFTGVISGVDWIATG